MTPKRADPVGLETKWNPMKDRPTPIAPGVAVPGAFTATLDLHGGERVVLDVEVIDRVPRCVALTVRSKDVTASGVRMPVQAWLDFVVANVAMTVKTTGPATVMAPPTSDEDADKVIAAAHTAVRRRVVDAELLTRAADAYRAGRIAGVQSALNVSEAQAYRYVRAARKRGLLEPHKRGKA